jgi:hypothetical protein
MILHLEHNRMADFLNSRYRSPFGSSNTGYLQGLRHIINRTSDIQKRYTALNFGNTNNYEFRHIQ